MDCEFDLLDLKKSCFSLSIGGKVEACLKDKKKDPMRRGGRIKRKMPFLEEWKLLGGCVSISLSQKEELKREKVSRGTSQLFACFCFEITSNVICKAGWQ